jgi:hypothetical protein
MATDTRAAFLDRGAWLGPQDAGRPISAEAFVASAFETHGTYDRSKRRLVVISPDRNEHDDGTEPIRDHLEADRLAHHAAGIRESVIVGVMPARVLVRSHAPGVPLDVVLRSERKSNRS